MVNKGKTAQEKKKTSSKKSKTAASRKTTAKPRSKTETKLKKEVTELKKENNKQKDQLLRTAAEFDNYKKRVERDFRDFSVRINSEFLKDILPILDDFNRSLESAQKESTNREFYQGIELIIKKFQGILFDKGLEPIEAVGKEFDPEEHEALMQMESDTHDSNIVIEEQLKGYKFKDQVIRHSKVIVSK